MKGSLKGKGSETGSSGFDLEGEQKRRYCLGGDQKGEGLVMGVPLPFTQMLGFPPTRALSWTAHAAIMMLLR